MPVDGTYPTATAQWEKRNIALEIPVWDEKLCIQCGKCVLVCPHAVIRAKVYDARHAGRRARPPSSPARASGRTSRSSSTPCRWRPRIAPAARSAWRSARPRTRPRSSTRPSTWPPSRRCASRERQLGLLPRVPETDRKSLSVAPGQGRAVAAAAVRVLRRLRRLRRNAVHQADDPALRRPRADRQRHRLLVDLRRQPAYHAVLHRTTTAAARPGPTRCSRTTPSSVSACAWPSTSRTNTRANWWRG